MTEFWLVKVIGKATAEALASPQVIRDVESGTLCVTGGELCEPLDVFDDQEVAMARMQACAARYGGQFKLVLSTDDFG